MADMKLEVDNVTVGYTGSGRRQVEVNLEGVDVRDVIKQLGADTLLEGIGREEAISHFNIEEATDE